MQRLPGRGSAWGSQHADPRRPGRGDAVDVDDEQGTTDAEPDVAEAEPAFAEAEAPGAETAAAEMEDRLRRALADLDNLRKRCDRELARARMTERAGVMSAWLQVVDHLELAASYARDSADPISQGVQVVLDEALAVLARLGYPRFEDVGERFDPFRHEAVSTVESDAPPGTIVTTIRPGYGSDEQILRPARVVVAREGHQ